MKNVNSKANTKNLNVLHIKELEIKIKNNSASNNFFVTTNEESLNLNDNTGENFIKSIISSDSLMDEMVKLKNGEEMIPVINNNICNASNMFNDDSFNRVLKENNPNKNFIQLQNKQVIENKSKNNFNLNLKQNDIPILNVEAAKIQVMNIGNKSNLLS